MKVVGCFQKVLLLVLALSFVHCEDCACGEANINKVSRIVNGRRTDPNRYPWMAGMISSKGRFMCGGSIISTRNILTAAHCYFYISDPLKAYWVLGMHRRTTMHGESFDVSDYEYHPSFSNQTFYDDFDMAMVTLKRPITFGFKTMPICLPAPDETFFGQKATVTGWGKMGENTFDPTPDVLMETKVMVKTDEECAEMIGKMVEYNKKSMICAYETETDACQGDSGGPLFVETSPNRHAIIGTVSFGEGCARAFPGIYARVATQETLDWLKASIEKSSAEVCK